MNNRSPDRRCFPAALACVFVIAVLIVSIGCGPSKGKLADTLKVEAKPELNEQGLNLKDWGVTGENFAIKLEATKDLSSDWLLTIQADGAGVFQTMTPLQMKAGQTQWIEVGGPKFLESFKVSNETKTVKVGLRNRTVIR